MSFLLERTSALLADEMGLGKTVQAAVALSERVRTGNINRALVIVPATLRLNWARELETWAPNLSVGGCARQCQGSKCLLPVAI